MAFSELLGRVISRVNPRNPKQLLSLGLVSKAWLAVVRRHPSCFYLEKSLGDLNLLCEAFPCLRELSLRHYDVDMLDLSLLASCTQLTNLQCMMPSTTILGFNYLPESIRVLELYDTIGDPYFMEERKAITRLAWVSSVAQSSSRSASFLQSLPSLKDLYLRHPRKTPDPQPGSFGEVLLSLSGLTRLSLEYCECLGPASQLSMTNLRKLELHDIKLSTEWLEAFLYRQPNLTGLVVTMCNLEDDSVGISVPRIVSLVEAGKQRRELSVPAPGLKSFSWMPGVPHNFPAFEPSSVARLTALEVLGLYMVTKFKKGGAFRCPALRELCLYDCHKGLKSAILPSGLLRLTKLQLDFNNIVDIDTFHREGRLITS